MLLALTLINLIFLVAGQQPHIIFVFIDDLGWNDVGYHGSEIMVRKGFFISCDSAQYFYLWDRIRC